MSRALRKACERSAAGLREVCERVGYKWLAEFAVEQVIKKENRMNLGRHDTTFRRALQICELEKQSLGWGGSGARRAYVSWVTCGEQLFSCRNCLRRAMP
mgnify:FL=1